jgi:hypothetical protein
MARQTRRKRGSRKAKKGGAPKGANAVDNKIAQALILYRELKSEKQEFKRHEFKNLLEVAEAMVKGYNFQEVYGGYGDLSTEIPRDRLKRVGAALHKAVILKVAALSYKAPDNSFLTDILRKEPAANRVNDEDFDLNKSLLSILIDGIGADEEVVREAVESYRHGNSNMMREYIARYKA